jgi:hypothetical protein
VAGVQRGDGVALLDGGSTNQQVIGRQRDAPGRLLSTDLTGNLGCAVGNRVHWDMLLHFVNERAAGMPDLWRVRANYAVHEFRKGHG